VHTNDKEKLYLKELLQVEEELLQWEEGTAEKQKERVARSIVNQRMFCPEADLFLGGADREGESSRPGGRTEI
jgi:hypothetical protein